MLYFLTGVGVIALLSLGLATVLWVLDSFVPLNSELDHYRYDYEEEIDRYLDEHPPEATKISFKKVRPEAKIPTQAKKGDRCFDVFACIGKDIVIPAGTTKVIPVGIAVEIPVGWEIQNRPKSGMSANKGIQVVLGTIDSGFRDELGVIVYNTGEHGDFTITSEMKVGQIAFARYEEVELVEVGEIDMNTDRGLGKFGSTGDK